MNCSFIIITHLSLFRGIFMLLFLIYADLALVIIITTILPCSLRIILARILSFSTFIEFTSHLNVFHDFIFHPRRQFLLCQSLLHNGYMLVDYIIENYLPEVQIVTTFWEHIT